MATLLSPLSCLLLVLLVFLPLLVFQSEEVELVLDAVAGCKKLFCGLLEKEQLFRGAPPGGGEEEAAMMGESQPI